MELLNLLIDLLEVKEKKMTATGLWSSISLVPHATGVMSCINTIHAVWSLHGQNETSNLKNRSPTFHELKFSLREPVPNNGSIKPVFSRFKWMCQDFVLQTIVSQQNLSLWLFWIVCYVWICNDMFTCESGFYLFPTSHN